jgi:uncharacterized RDD family membrane protein YckC
MNNLPRQKLREIVVQYGRSLCNEPLRTRGLLSDFCGQYRKEINVLVNAMQEGIPDKLILSSQNSIPQSIIIARLAKQLHDNLGIDEEAARWSVESWAAALNLVSSVDLEPESIPTYPVAPVSTPPNQTLPKNELIDRPPAVPPAYRQEVISPMPTATLTPPVPTALNHKLSSRQYAGFWKRLIAYVLDTVILFIPLTISAAIVQAIFGSDSPLSLLAVIVVCWLYYALQESSAKQATIGKQALGIAVVDLNGQRISFGKASGRFFGKYLSSFTLLIGFLMAAFTEKEQALHDLISGCLVVNRRSP